MTAALVMTACSSDDNDIVETPAAPQAQKTIPYTVTVSDDATTRATVSDDPTNRQLYFATGDRLYITGTGIKGVLDLQAGDAGKTTGATFSGELTYSGSGSPADDLSLTATLVSAQQTVGTQFSVDDAGAVTVNYPTAAYCSTISDAVQQYSRLTGTSTYGAKAFTLTQQTAFLNFEITFEDGTATGTALSAVVNNNSSNICSASVTTVTDNGVKAKFVLPVAAGTKLSSAKVTMGSKAAISFGGSQTLTGKVYNVKKTQAPAGAINGKFSVSSNKQVYFSKGNLQATYDGSSWTWAFATNQWDYIGNAAGNTSINGNGTVSVNNVTVDLFGWVGASNTTWTGAAQYGISNSTATNSTNGYGKNDSEALKSDWGNTISDGYTWFTLTSAEWTYLFNTRTTTSGVRYAKATVNGKSGVILLPDDWSTSYYSLSSTNTANAAYTTNSITSTDWTNSLEAHGAVFLPAAGFREQASVSNAGSSGSYWSSSSASYRTSAYRVLLQSGSLNPASSDYRYDGCSVRLVRQVE